MFELPDPDGYLSASEVKGIAEEAISPLPLPGAGVEGSPFDPGDIWLAVILACVNGTSIWETCNEHAGTPCNDTILTWLHTLNREWLEVSAHLQLSRLALTILDCCSRESSLLTSSTIITMVTTLTRKENSARWLRQMARPHAIDTGQRTSFLTENG